MPDVTFLQPDGTSQTVTAEDNLSLMQIGVEHGIPGIIGQCGGSMSCATCHVYIHPDWQSRVIAEDNEQSEEEIDILDMSFNVSEHSRLGCQVKVTKALDGLIVALPGTKTDW